MTHYDLIVVGGGFAGVAASVAAAREGLDVLLVEKGNSLGGACANGLVNPFMPYWTKVNKNSKGAAGTENGSGSGIPDLPVNKGGRLYLSTGIFREILTKLSEAGALGKNESTFDEEYLKLLLNRLVVGAGVKLLYHSYLTGADSNAGKINSITVSNKSGSMKLSADYYIDATGDADLAVICGFPTRLGREPDNLCQPMTLCFRLANVNLEAFERSRHLITPLYKELQAQGKIKNIREDVLIFSTLVDGMLHFNSTRVVKKNPVDAFDVTDAEIDAREQAYELYWFLRERIDGFQNSKLIMTAQQIGVRESRMIVGEYVLTGEDLQACVKFEDSIAAGNYDIDIHNPEGSGTSHYYFPEGEYYTIPYRSLIPKGSVNLLAAGRCVSATHEAQASIRIMPIVCCLGEAAGVAAAVASASAGSAVPKASAMASTKASSGYIPADVAKIQKILRDKGAFIGI